MKWEVGWWRWGKIGDRQVDTPTCFTFNFLISRPHNNSSSTTATLAAHTMATTTTTTTTDLTTRVPPSQSLYIQNLPEKLQKRDLQRNLYMLFTTYGSVLDITAVKSSKMRGQAHILFRDVNTATQAMRHTQGMDFFGRELVGSFSFPFTPQGGSKRIGE
jgi:hypothetical protein